MLENQNNFLKNEPNTNINLSPKPANALFAKAGTYKAGLTRRDLQGGGVELRISDPTPTTECSLHETHVLGTSS